MMKNKKIENTPSYCDYIISPEKTRQIALGSSIAKRVCELLEEQGMNQREFAHALGKTETEVSRWLSGTHNLTLATIAKMSLVLGDDIIAPTSCGDSVFKYSITSQPKLIAAEPNQLSYGEEEPRD